MQATVTRRLVAKDKDLYQERMEELNMHRDKCHSCYWD
jgi:hypothetical protein